MPESKQKISAWSHFPKIEGRQTHFKSETQIKSLDKPFIPQGALRNYGDCALAPHMLSMCQYNKILHFDNKHGLLTCQAGIRIGEILEVIIPAGWILPVCPGTQDVTLGGAIASDVHGKNHHHAGCFSETVIELSVLGSGSGKTLKCSRDNNSELFQASCGGMGLSGIIVSASLQLLPISSTYIRQNTIKTKDLQDTFAQFEHYKDATYAAAWIDCLAPEKQLGRAIVSIGEHINNSDIVDTSLAHKAALANYKKRKNISLPVRLPPFALNPLTLKLMNAFIYARQRTRIKHETLSLQQFLFPLDGIQHWNRAYGSQGFLQYQFVLPLENSLAGMQDILRKINSSKQGVTLAVLKLLGQHNDNYLSFPREGYTLALDFKNTAKVHTLLKELDQTVLKYGGRFYLAKDARLTKAVFEQGYPDIEKFRAFRQQHQLHEQFASLQSQRLAL